MITRFAIFAILVTACAFEPVYDEVQQPTAAVRELEACVVSLSESMGNVITAEDRACASVYLVAYADTAEALEQACSAGPEAVNGCYTPGSDVIVVSRLGRTEAEIERTTRHELFHHLLSCQGERDQHHERREWRWITAGACSLGLPSDQAHGR